MKKLTKNEQALFDSLTLDPMYTDDDDCELEAYAIYFNGQQGYGIAQLTENERGGQFTHINSLWGNHSLQGYDPDQIREAIFDMLLMAQ